MSVVLVAHHSLLLALPAFVPAVIVAGVVIVIAKRDRRRGDDDADGDAHSEMSGHSDQDGNK